MEQFRTSSQVVKINVNDDGYCVELHTSSDVWLKAFMDFLTTATKNAESRQEAFDKTDDDMEKINQVIAFDQDVKDGFVALFGEGAYEETFCSELVGAEYVVEFLNACMPYIEKRISTREKALKKYDPAKSGGAR